ncbi:MAG TPA: hypothetical protein VE569_00490 [Acidimicrobiia bacterium]|nr:hypothetical protein [Acidimicrobiia bacterium]
MDTIDDDLGLYLAEVDRAYRAIAAWRTSTHPGWAMVSLWGGR